MKMSYRKEMGGICSRAARRCFRVLNSLEGES